MSQNVPTYAFLWPKGRNKMNLGAASPPGPFFWASLSTTTPSHPICHCCSRLPFPLGREKEREWDGCCTVLTPSLIIHAPLNGRKKRRQSERATKLSLFPPVSSRKGPIWGREKGFLLCLATHAVLCSLLSLLRAKASVHGSFWPPSFQLPARGRCIKTTQFIAHLSRSLFMGEARELS